MAMQVKVKHLEHSQAIMDSGNNKRHSFRSLEYFPSGVRTHELSIMGVHGVEKVKVGIGTARFVTVCEDGSEKVWHFPGSIHNPESPVNLLCSDKFHFDESGNDTGHEWRQKKEKLLLRDGRTITVCRDERSHLPLLHVVPLSHAKMRAHDTLEECAVQQWCEKMESETQLFTHTHLQPHTTTSVRHILNSPLERRFNETIKHGLIEGVKHVAPIRTINRANRPDSWFEGKMTQRSVAKKSRRPEGVKLTPLSHIVSDIGVVPFPDKAGNKYFVLFRDECTGYRKVYRMKSKSELVKVWKQFLVDHNHISHKSSGGTIEYNVQYLVSDSERLYMSKEVENLSLKHGVGKWLVAPYTHQANPAESSMRRVMEGAVQSLYDSGLPPCFLLDALCCHVDCENRLFTKVYHITHHKNKSPYERVYGKKPHIDDIARFGCKTYVHHAKSDGRIKSDRHAWVGFYLGPSKDGQGCSVYRPSTNTVYTRYHTLHVSNLVYGDFMGKMYRERVDTDKRMREYYNSEVQELLGAKDSSSAIMKMLRAMPWALQRLPENAHTKHSPQLSTRTANTVPTHVRRAQPARTCAQTAQKVHAHATPTMPEHKQKRARDEGMTKVLEMPQEAPTERHRRMERRRRLQQLQPEKLQYVLEVVDSMVQFIELSESIVRIDEAAKAASTFLLYEKAEISKGIEYSFVKVCEETSRRIANSKVPRGYKQIQKLEGTVEGSLIKEAMLDEVLWMIEKGKVVPRDKKTIEEVVREIDGQWVVAYKKKIDGLLERVRARWVLRGDKQIPHVDYDPHSVYSPVASKTSTITALVLAVQFCMEVHALDVSKAFTVSKANKEGLYMKVPDGTDWDDPTLCPFDMTLLGNYSLVCTD